MGYTKQRQRAREYWHNKGQRRCPCCGVQLVYNLGQPNTATFEHLVPRSQGGTYELFNGLIVCSKCNNDRGNLCWIKWAQNKPKKEWLIRKYLEAVFEYQIRKKSISVKKKTKERAAREMS